MRNLIKGFAEVGRCSRERRMALELFDLLHNDKLSEMAREHFIKAGADVYCNPNSGYVFLSDKEYNTVMENNGELDLYITAPYNGPEGFFEELIEEFEDMHPEDQRYLYDMATEGLKDEYADKFNKVIIKEVD